MTTDDLVGQVGTVVTRIRGAQAPGEVTVPFRGGSETFIAYAIEEIERHAPVIVTGVRSGRAIEVARYA